MNDAIPEERETPKCCCGDPIAATLCHIPMCALVLYTIFRDGRPVDVQAAVDAAHAQLALTRDA